MVTTENSMEEIREYFSHDTFADNCGCKIIECDVGYSLVEMPITPAILNANGGVMGGAMFTLADFAMGVAANLDNKPTLAIEANIRFFTGVKGEKLIGRCTADKAGRSVGFYSVEISDDLGTNIAHFTCTAHRS
jgi:acyl-CoA thioesterase